MGVFRTNPETFLETGHWQAGKKKEINRADSPCQSF